METPYQIDRMPDELHYTYLDTFGRPVLVVTKNNLVEQHIQDVVVRLLTRPLSQGVRKIKKNPRQVAIGRRPPRLKCRTEGAFWMKAPVCSVRPL